jgi:MFS family permease
MDASREAVAGGTAEDAAAAGGIVLLTLVSAQFLMTLDSSVMNVSSATVAKDVGTTVTGIQTAITLYPLVMAALMITSGKVGQILGRGDRGGGRTADRRPVDHLCLLAVGVRR